MKKNIILLFMICPLIIQCGNIPGDNPSHSNQTIANIITFASDKPVDLISDNSIYMVYKQNLINKDEFTIDIFAKGLMNKEVLGIAFELSFDANIISYKGNNIGDLFVKDKVYKMIAPEEGSSNNLLVGIVTNDKRYKVNSDGVIATFIFNVNAKGDSKIYIMNSTMRDYSNKDINVDWYGGSISIN